MWHVCVLGGHRKHEGKVPPILGYDIAELEHWGATEGNRDLTLEGNKLHILQQNHVCKTKPQGHA